MRYNSTYEDCPIAKYADQTEFQILVAVHNPANLPIQIANIAVPHGKLAVHRFDVELGAMIESAADVLCDVQEEELYPSTTVNNCQLYLKHAIGS